MGWQISNMTSALVIHHHSIKPNQNASKHMYNSITSSCFFQDGILMINVTIKLSFWFQLIYYSIFQFFYFLSDALLIVFSDNSYGCSFYLCLDLFIFISAQYIHNYFTFHMLNLGLSVVIFLAIGVVVMALFCLITRYFNKKLEKALDDENQVYSMIQQIKGKEGNENQEDDQNNYENYVNKRQNDANKKDQKGTKFQLQMTEVKQPLKGYGDEYYGQGKLKRRLQGELLTSIPMNPETGRSLSSLKSFKPQRLDDQRKNSTTNRSNVSDLNSQRENETSQLQDKKKRDRKDRKKDNITQHKYVSKIVSYVQQGVVIIENCLISISKRDQIEQKRTIKNSTIKPDQSSFEDTLEAYGFQKGTFCAFKFECTVQIPHMKPNEEYPIASLKSTQSKQQIQFPQFYSLKDKLEEIS